MQIQLEAAASSPYRTQLDHILFQQFIPFNIYILLKELSEIIILINTIELHQNYQFAIGVKRQLPRQLLSKQF